jgi:hypothetical protein
MPTYAEIAAGSGPAPAPAPPPRYAVCGCPNPSGDKRASCQWCFADQADRLGWSVRVKRS